MAIRHFKEVKKGDLVNRKKAKASAKPKWTRQIEHTTGLIETLIFAHRKSKTIQRRVA